MIRLPSHPRLRQMCFAVLVAGASGLAAAAPTETLSIGTDLTYPPYNYLEKDQAAGFDAEFMRKLAATAGMTPKFIDTRFASLILGVNSAKFDVIASTLYMTAERAKQIDYIPYMTTGGVILAGANSAFKPKTPEDLCGKRVGSIKGAAAIAHLNKVSSETCVPKGRGAIDVREFPTSPETTQALISGGVDAQFEDTAVAKEAVNKTGGRVVISSDRLLFPAVVGLGISKQNKAVTTRLTEALVKLRASGEYDALLAKYNLQAPNPGDVKAALGE